MWKVNCQKKRQEAEKLARFLPFSRQKAMFMLYSTSGRRGWRGRAPSMQEAKQETQNARLRGRKNTKPSWEIDLISQNSSFLAHAPPTIPVSPAQAQPHGRQCPTASHGLLLMPEATRHVGHTPEHPSRDCAEFAKGTSPGTSNPLG